jgi:hypothetical protein
MKERLLFAALGGHYNGQRAAIIMQDHCLPIACSHKSYEKDPTVDSSPVAEYGFRACWQAYLNAEEFFEYLGIDAILEGNPSTKPTGWHPEGLYVYEVSYEEGLVAPDSDDDWSHLEGGTLRRPTAAELEPLTQGLAPWGGVVL